jgi:hypothetical protein
MRPLLLTLLACIAFSGSRSTQPPDVFLIDHLNQSVQRRFSEPLPDALGMSRIVVPESFGRHFQPIMTAERDFRPSGPFEENVIRDLEAAGLQVGFYSFGTAIAQADRETLNPRALKGPAAITRGTPRPSWYPGMILIPPANPAAVTDSACEDALPDWNAIYPLARKAMRSFRDGGGGFDTSFGSWRIAARPVLATQQSCVSCHNNPAYRPATRTVKLDQPIGGVLYAFRRG